MGNKDRILKEDIEKAEDIVENITKGMKKVIVGQNRLINRLILTLISRGHILLEGVPGLAKTTAIDTLSKVLNLQFQRIQFTPDLLPSDLVGSKVYNPKKQEFFVKKGPIFANFVLADEINRSPAKVQSALLESMQERQVTIGEDTFRMEDIFFVMATQNPIEQEGTYPLPEAQLDRFLLKTVLEYPSRGEELDIINMMDNSEEIKFSNDIKAEDILFLQKVVHQIYIDNTVKEYILDIVFKSREGGGKVHKDSDTNYIAFGASPRASIGLLVAAKAQALMGGRDFVRPEDVKEIAPDILRHRIIPSYEAEAEGISRGELVDIVLNSVKVP